MNKVILTGRLTKDSEVKQTCEFGDTSRLLFTLAVQRDYKNSNGEKEADFIPVVMWTKFADKLQLCLTKGKKISVTGRVNVSSFDGTDGTKKFFTQIIADNIEFLESKKNEAI